MGVDDYHGTGCLELLAPVHELQDTLMRSFGIMEFRPAVSRLRIMSLKVLSLEWWYEGKLGDVYNRFLYSRRTKAIELRVRT